jgi:hypothetical protein
LYVDVVQLQFQRENGIEALVTCINQLHENFQSLKYSTAEPVTPSILVSHSAQAYGIALSDNHNLRSAILACAVLVSLLTKYHVSIRATIATDYMLMLHLSTWLAIDDAAIQEAAISAVADLALDGVYRWVAAHTGVVVANLFSTTLVLVGLVVCVDENEMKIVSSGVIVNLVDLLNSPSVTVNLQAALALTNLSLNRMLVVANMID